MSNIKRIQTGLAKSDKMGYLGSQNTLLNLGSNQLYQPISKGINNFASHISGVASNSGLNKAVDKHGRGNSLDMPGNDHPLGPGWCQFKDLLAQIPGSTFDEIVPFRNVNLSSKWLDQFVEPGLIGFQNRS
jgi:hypothetical protein